MSDPSIDGSDGGDRMVAMMDSVTQRETESNAAAGEGARKPVDKNARLAIESGSGYHKALMDMANAEIAPVPAGVDDKPAVTETDGAARDVEKVGVDDLASALGQMDIRRLVLLTPFSDALSNETVLTLGRELSRDRRATILLQLDRTATGPESEADKAGWIDLLSGTRTVGDIIQRDPQSLLHVAASGNVDIEALEKAQIEDLRIYLDAFSKAYALSVLHMPISALRTLGAFDDAETALIIVAGEAEAQTVQAIARDLGEAVEYDILHLVAESGGTALH